MEFLMDLVKYPFVWGLLLGLLIAGFILKTSIGNRMGANKEIKRLEGEMRELQSHLNTQLKITASGSEGLTKEIETLKNQNENLRVNLATLQAKPEKAEQRQFRVYEIAVTLMREQAPGFAGAWEKAVRQAEAEVEATESGLKKFVRRVVPGLAGPAPKGAVHEAAVIENQGETH